MSWFNQETTCPQGVEFTCEEKELLVKLLLKYEGRLERSEFTSWWEYTTAWECLTFEFNASGDALHTSACLKKEYEQIKILLREKKKAVRRGHVSAVGGPSDSSQRTPSGQNLNTLLGERADVLLEPPCRMEDEAEAEDVSNIIATDACDTSSTESTVTEDDQWVNATVGMQRVEENRETETATNNDMTQHCSTEPGPANYIVGEAAEKLRLMQTDIDSKIRWRQVKEELARNEDQRKKADFESKIRWRQVKEEMIRRDDERKQIEHENTYNYSPDGNNHF